MIAARYHFARCSESLSAAAFTSMATVCSVVFTIVFADAQPARTDAATASLTATARRDCLRAPGRPIIVAAAANSLAGGSLGSVDLLVHQGQ